MSDLRTRLLTTHNHLKAYAGAQRPREAAPGGFQTILEKGLESVAEKQRTAATAVTGAITGGEGTQDLHRVMIAQEEAALTFELMLEVRNKLLEAYQQLMQMQI